MKRADYFRDFGDGSFRAVQFWVIEEQGVHTLYTANTVFEWEDVQGVQGWATPNPLPDNVTPEGAKCVLFWLGTEIKILAPFADVARAWREYRRRTHLPTIGAN
ncbi:hypothetical protein DNI29_04455 [Hymenobacter sediminis]|uniref:hypothetical protein n=1 Tax=Hymenobacter sediminis TaxID=2218621 RepID=UPI000DA67E5A|nr:hypothetical protein [Hymenobacter sediminis]RPD50054.1 hypothetical protein DNI29_04455 [Hymenobacter sediminis]